MNEHLNELKYNVIEKIFNFSHEPTFENSNVISKQYFHNVLFPKYMNNFENNNIVIYGDFNKLNNINQTLGYKKGDEVIYKSIETINSILPTSARIARIAGDEFIFILENTDLKTANTYIEQINNSLKKISNSIFSNTKAPNLKIGISCYASEFQKENSFYSAYKYAENQVSLMKEKNNKTKDDLNDDMHFKYKLTTATNKAIQDFFDTLRLTQLQPDSINTLYTVFDSLISKSFNSISEKNNNKYTNSNNNLSHTNHSNLISSNEATIIDNIIHNYSNKMDINQKNLSKISYTTLTLLTDKLMRNPNTSEISKNAFIQYVLKSLTYPISINLFSSTFLKVSNTLQGHLKTDADIANNAKLLHTYLTNICQFNDNPYLSQLNLSSLSSNMLVSLNGADTLLICRGKKPISYEILKTGVDYINSKSPILKLVFNDPVIVNSPTELLQYISKLQVNTSRDTKNKLKANFINSNECIDLFKIHFKEPLQIFYNYLGNDSNIDKKVENFQNFISSSIKLYLSKNIQLENTNKEEICR